MRDGKFYLFILFLFAAFSLTACGSGGDDTTTTSGTAVPGGGGAPGGGSGSWSTGVLQAGSDSTDYAIGMVKDTSGNIYILGYTDGDMDVYTNMLGPWDIFLIKYDSSGVKQWTRMLQSDRDDRPFAIAYDGSDSIYITGYTSGDMDSQVNPDDGEHLFISKFSTGGDRLWTKLYETAVTSKGYGIACYDGNVYVTGTGYNGEATGFDLFVAKFDGSGTQIWLKYNSGGDSGETIALDASGNIYVAGTSGSGMVLYKFDSSGTEVWKKTRAEYYIGRGLVLDSSANLYFTGSTNTWHAYLAKYDKDGNLIWENPIESLLTEGGNAVVLDGSGNIYVIGGTRGDLNGEINNGNYDMFLIKYYPGGKLAWTTLLGTAAWDAGAGFVMQGENILTYGHTAGVLGSSSLGGQDYFFALFDSPSGTLQ